MRPDPRSLPVICAIALLGAVEAQQGYTLSVLTPEVAATLQVAAVSIVSARIVGFVVSALVPLVVPVVGATRRRDVQVWVCRASAIACAAVLAATGKVGGPGELVAALGLAAAAGAPGHALRRAMVAADADGPVRVSTFSVISIASILAQLALALSLATGLVGAWQTAFEAEGVVGAVVVAVSVAVLRPKPGYDAPPPADDLPWKEVSRAWRATPSLVAIAITMLAVAMLVVPFDAVLSIALHSRWQLTTKGTGAVFAVLGAASLVAVVAGAARAGRARLGPDALAGEVWPLLLAASVAIGVGGCLPSRTAMVVLVAIGSALIAAIVPMVTAVAFAVVPASQRRQLSAAMAAVFPAGSILGAMTAVAFADRHGARSALVSLAAIGAVAALWWGVRARAVPADLARAAGPQPRDGQAASTGRRRPPLLECRGINFSYGSLQVLFDVDFTIDAGEVVALLGTNGAGKSTLLKVISGIGLPQRGSVRLAGRDITYLDAEDRVRAGVVAVPGGRAVFGSMTVVENLQSFGYTLGRDRPAVAEAVDRCLAAFPRLAERRTSPAATLSGGEQQMVGLSKALILRPQLLLIDELSLGLAPAVIGPLLEMVRRINAAGTAVVIVEQSVNLALSLVDHAYYMEKGAIRFDGRASDLLEHSELLRAVFLQGAVKGMLR